ncbi:MAG: hypothetical protein V4439_01795 [Patescibacteria group bacterium]
MLEFIPNEFPKKNRNLPPESEILWSGGGSPLVDENKEDFELMLVNKTIELIEQNPNLAFILSGNGNVIDKNDKRRNGGKDYFFDKKQQKMAPYPKDSLYQGLDFNILDIPGNKNGELKTFGMYWNFLKAYKKNFSHEKQQLPFNIISLRLPFKALTDNPYCIENRPSTHLSFGLMYPNNKPEIFDSFGEEKIKEYLKNPDTDEAKKFLLKLFDTCAKKWIPEYWNFYIGQLNLYKKNIQK